MSTTPTEYKYYPALSGLMKPEDLPDFLSFIKDGLQTVFDKMYYKDYQTSKSTTGSSAFHSLDIVSPTKLALELPGTGVFFVLNPDYEDSKISSFPITVFWEWEVMRYIRYFNNNGFSFSPEDFYELALQILNISEEQIIELAINTFVVQSSPTLSKFGQLVLDINTLYNASIAIDESSDNRLQELIVQVSLLDKKIAPAIFSLYLLSTDLAETKDNVKTFFSSFIPNDVEEYIKKIITPKARVTLELAAAIEFPRKILVPWKNNGTERDEDETHIAKFQFAKALLYADTEVGIGYNLELGGSLNPQFCEIGRSGMLIQIENLKLDLSKKTNIPEADVDGRPNDFVGAYARAVSVTLPAKWFHDYKKEGQGTTSTTLKIGASDLLIGTGGLSGDIYLETVPVSTGVFNYFGDKFDFDYPLIMFEKNEETEVVEIKKIADYDELLLHLQELSAASSLPYPFNYPLKLTTKPTLVSSTVSANTAYTFKNAKEYQEFLSQLQDNTLWKRIGSSNLGFEIGFNKFDISFKQNKVIGSNIKGQLILGKLKDNNGDPFHAYLEGHLYDDGDFNLTASFEKGSEPTASLFGLVNFDFNSFELGKQDDDYYVGTSCHVSFPPGLMNNLTKGQGFDVEKLRIYSDGSIEVEGGSIPIPISLSVNLGPVQMSVTNINFGSTQINNLKYNFWGFDGAISVNPLGVDARGEGIKYYYPTGGEGEPFIRIQTIEVDLMIPGTATEESAMAIIHGMISLPEPGVSPEFKGEVSLKLPKAKISGSVGMRFAPKYPAFLVDASIELPTGIPLGFISITGFRGLLGFRYVATKKAAGLTLDDSWYDFYKHPKPGININKFSGPPDSLEYDSPFSIGAGATFETTGASVLTLRAMLLLSLPTLFYIEAGLSVLSGRLGPIEKDQSTPPFFAMVAFGDDSLEMAAGADFQMPKDGGQIFQLHALLEAGFFFKNQKPWYINIGSKKDPITARILTLFTAKAFIMLSAQGIEAGARLDFKLEKSFGPAKVKLWAYLELGGKISFKRPQMGGYITAGGGIQIKIWIINIEIVLDTIFSVESFKPFLIYAKLELSVRVKIGFIRVRKNFLIELQWDINRIVDRTPYSPLPKGTEGDGEENRTLENVKGVHMLTNEAFALDYFDIVPNGGEITKVIPLDTYIDIKMVKGLLPNPALFQKIGGYTGDAKNYTDMMPPVSTQAGRKLRQVKHQYSIQSIGIKSWNGTAWEDYHPFEAVVENKTATRDLVKNLPWAQWQKVIDQYDSIRVLATDPFSFLSAGEPGWYVPEQFGITSSKLFCVSEGIEEEKTNFLNKQIGLRYYVPSQYEADKINGLFFKLIGDLSEITENNQVENGDFMSITGETNPHGYNRSLSFSNENQLEIIFPESAIEPTLKLTTQAKEVVIEAFTAIIKKEGDKLITYEPIKIRKTANGTIEDYLTYTKAELLTGITLFSEEDEPISKTKIDKIVIIPLSANAKRIYEIRNEIAQLFNKTYSSESGEISISLPSEMSVYNALLAELATLKADAGNDNTSTGTPNALTFTRYYGYKGKNSYAFDKIIKYNDTYIIAFHPKASTTALLQINSKGDILRERLLNGVVTSMQVVNDKLLITQALNANQCKGIGEAIIDLDFIVGCLSPIAAMAIIELDDELNLSSGVQYLNSYSLGFNKVLPLADNELLWINTLENETQINWVNGTDRTLIQSIKINGSAIKVLQHNDTEFSLITKDKKIIRFNLNNNTSAITKVISDVSVSEIIDAVIANGKTVMSVKFTNGKFGLAQITEDSLNIVKHDTIFDTAVYLSNNALNDNSIIAYNEDSLFVFNTALELTRLIKRGSTVDNASIIHVQNEPSVNEILMLSSKPNEKGVYFSLFNDQFDNCSLYPAETVTVTTSISALTTENTSLTGLASTLNVNYIRGAKNSKLITVNDTICSNGENSEEDPELDYTTYIQSINWLSKESYYHNKTIPQIDAVEGDREAMKAAVENTVQPIWRPNTTYCLDFVLTDTVDDKTTTNFEYHYGFKTLGPVGHYPVPDPVVPEGTIAPIKNELTELSKSPLTSLRQYLDYNRSYPNADGSLLQSKPAFYGNEQCKVSLFFTSPYVYHMFKKWEKYTETRPEIDGVMNLIIKDPLTDLLIEYPFKEEIVAYPKPDMETVEWLGDDDPKVPLGIQMINNIISDKSAMRCSLEWGNPLKPKSYAYNVTLTNLKPTKLYTILVNNFFDDKQNGTTSESQNVLVHQYGFQTSRYRDFKEQVESYYSNEALYDIKLNLVQDQIGALHDIISELPNTSNDSLALKYQHPFDRAIEGILKISPLDPAQSTEANKIIDTNTNQVIALLIRNPEPFNIPKMPLEEIKDTISVVNITYNAENKKVYTKKEGYNVLYSKDYSQVLIMHDSKIISESDLDISFDYRMWNNAGTPLTVSVDKQDLHLELENTNL